MAETIGMLALTAAGLEGITGATVVANIIGTTVIAAGTAGAAYALQRTPQQPGQRGQLITRQALPKRRRAYGQVKLGGPLLLSRTVDGKRHQVIALHQGEISEFLEHWLQEFHVTLGTGGIVVDKYIIGGTPPVPHMAIDTRPGTDTQAAFATLLSDVPEVWTTDHRGLGIAMASIMYRQPDDKDFFTIVFPGGTPPAYRAVLRASKVWDPRDPTQSRTDRSTWKFSENPPLCTLDYHRHEDGMGLSFFRDAGGVLHYSGNMDQVFFSDDAIEEDWITAANICDDVMANGEKRYRCAGSYELPMDTPAKVAGWLLSTCDGEIFQRGDGGLGMRVGKTVAPGFSIGPKDILGFEGMVRGDNVRIACNQITAQYTSRDHDYQDTDAQPWRNEAKIAALGRVESESLDLRWVPSHSQARRLMKLAMARRNPEWRGILITGPAGMAARKNRYGAITAPLFGMTNHSAEVASFSAQLGGGPTICRIGIASLGQSALDFDYGSEAGTPPPIPSHVQGT